LTLVLPKSDAVPDVVTAGGKTVGVRWPSHPFAQAVIRACGFPLAAPSANLASRTSPTRAEHVLRSLGGRISLIVDGGPCQVGIESTVLDLSSRHPRILRPGVISATALEAVIGPIHTTVGPTGSAASRKSPGLFAHHYAPRARLRVLTWDSETALHRQLVEIASDRPSRTSRVRGARLRPRVCVIAHTSIPSGERFHRVSVVPHDPEAFARALYAELHQCDAEGADCIVVEAVPDAPAWHGVADRLRRAERSR
jgi:L-threonylcarbamoyladenylate synthase